MSVDEFECWGEAECSACEQGLREKWCAHVHYNAPECPYGVPTDDDYDPEDEWDDGTEPVDLYHFLSTGERKREKP